MLGPASGVQVLFCPRPSPGSPLLPFSFPFWFWFWSYWRSVIIPIPGVVPVVSVPSFCCFPIILVSVAPRFCLASSCLQRQLGMLSQWWCYVIWVLCERVAWSIQSSRGHDGHSSGGNLSPRRRYRLVNSRCHHSSSFASGLVTIK